MTSRNRSIGFPLRGCTQVIPLLTPPNRTLLSFPIEPLHCYATPSPGNLFLRVAPHDLSRATLKGLLGAFEIRPSIETVALDKRGLMGMQ